MSYEYPPHTGFGGIGTYTYYQANALRALGHEVHVIAGWGAPRALEAERQDGLTIWRGRSVIRPAIVEKTLSRLKLHWSINRIQTAISMYEALAAVHAAHRLDVVEMPECGGEGALSNHLLGIPAVVRFHSPARLIMSHYATPRADRLLCPLVERIAMSGATRMTSCSSFLAEEVRTKVGRAGWQIETIHNGIDPALFDDAAPSGFDLRGRFGVASGARLIFFSGRLEPRKGAFVLGDVLAQVLKRSDCHAVIAGADLFHYARDTLVPRFAAEGLGGRVHFTGALTQPEVRAALTQSDIFFMPSQWEACPYACLEAMAARKPIVGSGAGGMPELLDHEDNALVVPSTDSAGYAAALLRLLDEPALARRLGDAARATITVKFDHLRQAERSVALYQECLK